MTTSVIIPVHGGATITERCLDAVLGDLHADAEVIVVDDASQDETPSLLERYADAIRIVRLERNRGYAGACNQGAAVADGSLLVFLNNDTEPYSGWLHALEECAERHPEAAAIGAKLLYPGGRVQHAGVVFGQDGYPHHLYAGFPSDHPAVNRSRNLQAVTGACMLVRRECFSAMEGFDTAYVNSLEDVDLCLRLGDVGKEVRYCPYAVAMHLESTTRGRTDRFEASLRTYRQRWRDKVDRDDLATYVSDGLLKVEYPMTFPIRLAVDPRLASVDRGREEKIERLLATYAGQVSDLLLEVVRLTVARDLPREDLQGAENSISPGAALDHEDFLVSANRIEEEIRGLGVEVTGRDSPEGGLGYRYQVESVRSAIAKRVPAGSTVLVVSRGDRELVRLDGRTGRHFPCSADGGYKGSHPADSDEAIAELERLRAAGADFLVFPPTASWWLDYYEGLRAHLDSRYARLDAPCCEIFELADAAFSGEGSTLPR